MKRSVPQPHMQRRRLKKHQEQRTKQKGASTTGTGHGLATYCKSLPFLSCEYKRCCGSESEVSGQDSCCLDGQRRGLQLQSNRLCSECFPKHLEIQHLSSGYVLSLGSNFVFERGLATGSSRIQQICGLDLLQYLTHGAIICQLRSLQGAV